MSRTTGPVLATGAITIVNRTVFSGQPMDWRIPVATGLTAVGFSLAERVWPTGAQIMAWTALTTIILTRTDARTPSPAENALAWWQKGRS
jgi:hypothetical protein